MSVPLSLRRGALALLVVLLAAGCESVVGTPPAPTPADFPGIASALAQRGLRLDGFVAGDPGCDDQALARTAIRFEASGLDQPAPTRVYAYIFRNREAFDRLLRDVVRCAGAFNTDPEGEPWVAVSPFVLTGPGGPWPPAFDAAVRDAIAAAAGTGG